MNLQNPPDRLIRVGLARPLGLTQQSQLRILRKVGYSEPRVFLVECSGHCNLITYSGGNSRNYWWESTLSSEMSFHGCMCMFRLYQIIKINGFLYCKWIGLINSLGHDVHIGVTSAHGVTCCTHQQEGTCLKGSLPCGRISHFLPGKQLHLQDAEVPRTVFPRRDSSRFSL